MEGYIYIENENNYTFYFQTGNKMDGKILIDGNEIISNWLECSEWNETPITNRIYLNEGYHKVNINLHGGKGTDWRLKIRYSIGDSLENMVVPFKYSIL